MPQYKRPPITEAVIEVRFEPQLAHHEVEELKARFHSDYPSSEERAQLLGLEVKLRQREARLDELSSGYKLASADQADVVLVLSTSFACSRLAPYVGWDAFRTRAKENWQTWKSTVGDREIQRLGVRYINRIDIPVMAEELRVGDYLNVYPEENMMPFLDSYAMQLVGSLGEDDCRLVVSSRTERSPLVDHASVVLDVDVSREADVPQNDQELWALIDRIRTYKNRVFEAGITDKARELFNQ